MKMRHRPRVRRQFIHVRMTTRAWGTSGDYYRVWAGWVPLQRVQARQDDDRCPKCGGAGMLVSCGDPECGLGDEP